MDTSPDNRKNKRESAARERFARIYATLRDRICMLDYPPGTRLREETLAEEFGISRTPLRRVLGWLESEGLLRSVQGVGTIVTDVDIEALAQVYQLRMELAEMLGRLKTLPPDGKTLAVFRELHQRSRALLSNPDPRQFARLNMDFFFALMRLTDNEPYREVSERLYFRTARIWLKSISRMDLRDEMAIFSHEVGDILRAVEIGDLGAVGYIRRSHISMSFTRLRTQSARSENVQRIVTS